MSRSLPRCALVVLALLLGGLAGGPAASAASEQAFPIGGAEFQRAVDVAQAHWSAVPCQGQVRFSWQGLEPLTNARATWSNPTDAWSNPGANFGCTVVLNSLTQYDFPMLCTVMAHELGHLLGRQHEAQDGQLMSPVYSTPLTACGGAPAQAASGDGDPLAWSVSEPKARTKTAKKSSSKRKRCLVRMKAGKRVRRCVTLKKRRLSRKARTASYQPSARHYVAH